MLNNNLVPLILNIDNFDFSNNKILKQDTSKNIISSQSIQSIQSSQIFKSNIPINMLIDLFNKICIK